MGQQKALWLCQTK